jgi:hypothetical protein
MKKTILAVLCFGFVGLGACRPRKNTFGITLANKASFNLNCPKSQLRYHKLSERQYGVSGCGVRSTFIYVCRKSTGPGGWGSDKCDWIKN